MSNTEETTQESTATAKNTPVIDSATSTMDATNAVTPTVIDNTNVTTGTAADIEKIEAAITALKTSGEDLCADEIVSLEAKRDVLVAKLEAETKVLETEVKTDVAEVETEVTTVWDKIKAAYIGYIREPLTILLALGVAYLVFKQF